MYAQPYAEAQMAYEPNRMHEVVLGDLIQKTEPAQLQCR